MYLWNRWASHQRLYCFGQSFSRRFSNHQRNYYDVLGVSKSASQQEIKNAFYNLSKKYHPDVVGADSKRFLEIKEAYDILKDEDKRRAYDSGYDNIGFDPFGSQRPQSDFSRGQHRNVRRPYDFRQQHYSQDEIDRIWRQFQEQVRNRANSQYDAEMRRRVREKVYDDYIKRRTFKWEEYAKDHDKSDNAFASPNYGGRGWRLINKIILTYFIIFFIVALFRTTVGPIKREEKIVITRQSNEPSSSYNYQKERLQRIMETPPIDQKPEVQIDPNYPYGLPKYDGKE